MFFPVHVLRAVDVMTLICSGPSGIFFSTSGGLLVMETLAWKSLPGLNIPRISFWWKYIHAKLETFGWLICVMFANSHYTRRVQIKSWWQIMHVHWENPGYRMPRSPLACRLRSDWLVGVIGMILMCSAEQMYWSSKCSLVINSYYWSSAFMNGNVDIVVMTPAFGTFL